MAYQRTEYADKTLSMNSLADRKLRIKLGSIDSHKETIEKELKRERKKLQKELGGIDDQRCRLTVSDIGDPNRSPRFARRYSTPPELLSASLPPSLADPKKSPLTTRRRFGSDNTSTEHVQCTPLSPVSPTSMALLKAPFDQPRRQSLPPIGDGGLLSAESHRKDRRGSHSGGTKSPLVPSPTASGASSPRSLSRKSSSLNEHEMSEVTAKVSRFLQKIDLNKDKDDKKSDELKHTFEMDKKEQEYDQCRFEELQKLSGRSQGTFQPLNFE